MIQIMQTNMLKRSLLHFFHQESSVGILLILATLLAMLMANSALHDFYEEWIHIPVMIRAGDFEIAKPLLLWINDGLMAIFFFMIGLEVKREVIEGSLNSIQRISLPLFGALGGMILPALIYTFFNYESPSAMHGWGVPVATDIAFTLGILSFLGTRVPHSVKIFLLALAIIDDLGAIVIIALFYSSKISMGSLFLALVLLFTLFIMNNRGVKNYSAYILVGIILWTALLKSGVHATLAGVALGFFIPFNGNKESFMTLQESLHMPVNFVILPLFAFANAGISLNSVTLHDVIEDVTLGIALGLFLGKQFGIFLMAYIALKLKFAHLPIGMDMKLLYAISVLSGIGFTMSLFIGSLAFECSGGVCFDMVDERLGILIGSLCSAICGYILLRIFTTKELDV